MTDERLSAGRAMPFRPLLPSPRPRALVGLRLERRPVAHAPAPAERAEPVLELFVRDLERSVSFYTRLGFSLEDQTDDDAELSWDGRRLRLRQPPRLRWAFAGEVDATPRTHLRLVVAEVDALWQRALDLELRLVEPLTDHADGSRDFMLADPDGFGLRLVSPSIPEVSTAA